MRVFDHRNAQVDGIEVIGGPLEGQNEHSASRPLGPRVPRNHNDVEDKLAVQAHLLGTLQEPKQR